jgi:hypothetical protein
VEAELLCVLLCVSAASEIISGRKTSVNAILCHAQRASKGQAS